MTNSEGIFSQKKLPDVAIRQLVFVVCFLNAYRRIPVDWRNSTSIMTGAM